MKKTTVLSVCLLLLQYTALFSQSYDTTQYFGKMNYTFHYVNKSIISTGILQDYGIEFLNLDNYAGTSLHDSNYVGLQELRLLYSSLYSCQINNNSLMQGPDSINRLVNSYNYTSMPLTFAGLYYQYDRLKDNAFSSNLLSISNDRLYDVAGRSTTPFQTEELFALAPTRQAVRTGSNQFIFRPELLLSNTGKTISSIAYDAAGGNNYTTVSFNTPFNVTYDTSGFYNFNLRITYTDNSIRYSHTKLVAYGLPVSARYGNWEPTPPTIETLTTTTTYLGQTATGDIIIDLAANNFTGQIRKPLIVVEGFDPDGDFDYDDLVNPGADDFVDRMTFDLNTGAFITLNDQLDNVEEYDIIYVNWRNGTDFIQRNALLLQLAIETVNSRKTTHNGVRQQNVIIGQSMGGLVARYTLRNMELNSINHETRLFISHDAPHWGANIPVSAQAAVQFLAPWQLINVDVRNLTITWEDLFPGTQEALNLMNTPAARQMMIQHYSLSGQSLSANNGMHTTFMNELSTMGWPVNSRNVTISNGSCNGTKIFPDNSTILTVDGTKTVNYLNNLWVTYLISGASIFNAMGVINGWGSPQFNSWAMVWQYPLSILSFSKSKYIVDFKLRAVPASGTQEIFRADIYSRRKLLGIFPINSYFMKCHVNSLSGMLPLDNAPGSTYDVAEFGFDANEIQANLPDMMDFVTVSLLQPEFCFIPTVSALDHSNPATNLTSNICANISCNLPAAVTDYYTPPSNELHISFTQANANYILQRQNPSFNCAKICPGSTTISGPDQFCSTSSPYTITNLPGNASVTWATSYSGFATANCPGCTSTTLSLVSDGVINLTATINNVCVSGTATLQKNGINAGFPYFGVVPSGPDTVLPSAGYQFLVELPYGFPIESYYWRVPSGWSITYGQGTPHIYVQTGPWGSGGAVEVDITGCGLTRLTHKYVEIGWGGNTWPDIVYPSNPAARVATSNGLLNNTAPEQVATNIFPIPANDQITIQETGSISRIVLPQTTVQTVEIIDKVGHLVYRRQLNKGSSNPVYISTSKLKSDVYIVRTFNGKSWMSYKILVKH